MPSSKVVRGHPPARDKTSSFRWRRDRNEDMNASTPGLERKSGSALSKAIAAMRIIVDAGRPLTVAEIAARLDVPRQTGHRLIRQFEEMSLVARTVDRERYVIGKTMMALARDIMTTSHAWHHVRAILEDLVAKTNETGNVGILDGYRVLYVERVECNWPLRVQLEAGSRVPVHATAIGKLLLAYLPEQERKKIIESLSLDRFTEATIVDRAALEAECRKIRKRGYSLNLEEYLPGIVGIGVPIINRSGAVIAGIALHAPSVRLSVEKLMTLLGPLKAAAQAISRHQSD